jgi:hypothetical protein
LETAKLLLDRMREVKAKDPDDRGGKPGNDFIGTGEVPDVSEASAPHHEFQNLLQIRRVEGNPPGNQRAIQGPLQAAHVTEPNDGFVVGLGGESFAAEPEAEEERREEGQREVDGASADGSGIKAEAILDLRRDGAVDRPDVRRVEAGKFLEPLSVFPRKARGCWGWGGRNGFDEVSLRKLQTKGQSFDAMVLAVGAKGGGVDSALAKEWIVCGRTSARARVVIRGELGARAIREGAAERLLDGHFEIRKSGLWRLK